MSPALFTLPGHTGPDESKEAAQGGGFAWSCARAAEFGDVCKVTVNGQDAVLLTGEAGVRAFYDTARVARAGAMARSTLGFLSDGVTPVVPSLDGVDHAVRKGALLRGFSPDALSRYLPQVDGIIARYVERWTRMQRFDLKAELTRMAYSAMSKVLLGSEGSDASFADYTLLIRSFVSGADVPLGLAARDRLLTWYRGALAAQRQAKSDRQPQDFLGILMQHGALTDEQIVAELQHAFTAAAGVWVVSLDTLALLARTPAALAQVREDLKKVGLPSTLAQLDGCAYVQSVVEETARWAPIINTQVGRVVKAFELGGHHLPEGTLVLAGLYATNHDPRLHPAPDAYLPERFEKQVAAGKASACPFSRTEPFKYVPFGGGDRSTGHRCLGEPLVYLVLKLLLNRVARTHTWTATDPQDGAVPVPHLAPSYPVEFKRNQA